MVVVCVCVRSWKVRLERLWNIGTHDDGFAHKSDAVRTTGMMYFGNEHSLTEHRGDGRTSQGEYAHLEAPGGTFGHRNGVAATVDHCDGLCWADGDEHALQG